MYSDCVVDVPGGVVVTEFTGGGVSGVSVGGEVGGEVLGVSATVIHVEKINLPNSKIWVNFMLLLKPSSQYVANTCRVASHQIEPSSI